MQEPRKPGPRTRGASGLTNIATHRAPPVRQAGGLYRGECPLLLQWDHGHLNSIDSVEQVPP